MNHIVILILYSKIFDKIEDSNDNKDTIEKSTKEFFVYLSLTVFTYT